MSETVFLWTLATFLLNLSPDLFVCLLTHTKFVSIFLAECMRKNPKMVKLEPYASIFAPITCFLSQKMFHISLESGEQKQKLQS